MRTLLAVLVVLCTPAFAGDVAAVTTAELARRNAPVFQFDAWIPGDGSPMNKTEDHFPMSVERFFTEGKARVVARESRGPNTRAVREITETIRREKDRITGVPRNMAGDEPGAAPLYWHAYARAGVRYIEYWVFYPMDRCRVRVLGVPLPIGGHRGDWEGITVALDAEGHVAQGYFARHGETDRCARSEMRFSGEHPVVFVSQGKHASYPEPGRWHDVYRLDPVVTFDEFFLGNGFAWRSWEGELRELDHEEWLDYAGRWGPDRSVFGIGGSPVGPKQHGSWESAGRGSKRWSDVRRSEGLELLPESGAR